MPKRVPATHNFTYEFDPFGKLPSSSSNAIKKGSRNVTNIGQGGTYKSITKSYNKRKLDFTFESSDYDDAFTDSPTKPSDAHQNSNNLQIHMESALPKLHPRSDTILDVNLSRRENITSYGKGGNLPNISKHERNVERSITSRNGRRKISYVHDSHLIANRMNDSKLIHFCLIVLI